MVEAIEPPGPSMWSSLGLVRGGVFTQLPAFLASLVRRYGDVSAFRVPWRRFVFVNDPQLVKEILVTQQHQFGKSHGFEAMRLLLGEGLLTSEEPLHRQMRRIVQPAFHRERIAAYAGVMSSQATAFAGQLDGSSFDMHAAMTELTLRIATLTLFGVDAGSTAETVSAALHEIMEVFPLALGPLAPLRRRLRTPSQRRFERSSAQLDRIVLGLIEERRREETERSDVLSLLLEERDEESGFAPSDLQVRDEVMTLFLAGHETTANALTWTWYLLATHPDVEARLHREIDAVIGARPPGFEDVARLTYTANVLRESLRLYPPAWIIGRRALRDVTVGNYLVRAGTTVLVSPLVMHRTARYFPDPERFDPDRWERNGEPAPFAYFPFGGGARRCIGEQFALTESAIVLAAFARSLRFTLDARTIAEPQAMITLRPRYPMWMHALRR
ncbi:MAG: cytochrome P450 [Vulcanimicrobiaceae bacterium]